MGTAGTFAFYPNKQMTTGEGGVVVTNDQALDALFKSLRNQGRDSMGGWLHHERLGFNYRLSDINCALGLSQLARIDEFLAARRRVAELYRQQLAEIDEIELPIDSLANADISWFVYVIRLRHATSGQRTAFMEYLRTHGVACANYFEPIHLQPYFRRMGYNPGDFPVSEGVSERTVALPFFNRLEQDEVTRVASAVRQALNATAQSRDRSVGRSALQASIET